MSTASKLVCTIQSSPCIVLFNGGFRTWQCIKIDMESEASLLSRETVSCYNGKKASHLVHLPAVLRRQLAGLARIAFVVRDDFSYAEAHFHFPTLSSALSNTDTIVSTSQETRRKLEEDAAIEKRSRSTEVNGAVTDGAREKVRLRLRYQEMTPNHLATGYKSIRTYLIDMLRFMDTPPLGALPLT